MSFSYSNFLRIILIHLFVASAAHAEGEKSWLREPPATDLDGINRLPIISAGSIYEVVPTKIFTGLVWHLANKTHAEIGCDDANLLTGGHFVCEAGKHPVLVRAVYTNGGTGHFIVRYNEKAGVLYIFHGSLGERVPAENVSLVINLPVVPRIIYAWVGNAK